MLSLVQMVLQVKTWFQNRRAKWRRLKQVRGRLSVFLSHLHVYLNHVSPWSHSLTSRCLCGRNTPRAVRGRPRRSTGGPQGNRRISSPNPLASAARKARTASRHRTCRRPDSAPSPRRRRIRKRSQTHRCPTTRTGTWTQRTRASCPPSPSGEWGGDFVPSELLQIHQQPPELSGSPLCIEYVAFYQCSVASCLLFMWISVSLFLYLVVTLDHLTRVFVVSFSSKMLRSVK